MRVYPFSSYLDYFPSSYGEPEVARAKLKDFAFPVNPEILENKGTGLIPVSRNGQDFYNVRELVGFSRMYSIPNEGFIAKKAIRHAEILHLEIADDNLENQIDDPLPENLKIKVVHISAAFMPPKDKRRGSGHMVFICPFCGCIHLHGAGGEKFGDGNGYRQPHCTCNVPAFFRKDRQELGKDLAYHWQFNLVEAEDFRRAGDFPKYFAKDLVNRRKG